MYLKYCNQNDLEYLKDKYQLEIQNLLLQNEDSTYKNFIIYDFIKNSNGEKNKLVDCGSGPSPLAWLLCNDFKECHMIDISVKSKFQKENLYHNIGDFFSYMEKHEDNSVDYATDGCSLTHFEYNEIENLGLKKSAKLLFRKIKSGGYLVVASDVIPHTEISYHNQTEFIKVSDMIKIYESEGFKIIGDFDYESMEEKFSIDLEYHGISRFNLNYCNLIFQKP